MRIKSAVTCNTFLLVLLSKTELQARAEKEIRDLGVVKEKLEAEWEQVKFMGQEENTELREKMEDLEETITQEQERKKEAEEKLEAQNKLLIGIREGLDQLVDKLFLGDSQVLLGKEVKLGNN